MKTIMKKMIMKVMKIMKLMKMNFMLNFKLNFILSICVAFCISNLLFADDDLPDELKQIREYFNNPPAITNLTFVMTNYISPYAFRDMNEVRKATKLFGFDPTKPTVNYRAYSYDPAIPGIVYRSFPAKYFKDHVLQDLTILTNLPDYHSEIPNFDVGSIHYGGRSNDVWWTATPHESSSLSFLILTNSPDGLRQWATNDTTQDISFQAAVHGDGSIFSHFGFGMFEAGSWKVEHDHSHSNLFKWRGISSRAGAIGGNLWHTNDNQWIIDWRTNLPKRELTIRLKWDLESKMPKQFFAVKLFKDEDGNDHEGIYQSFTKVNSPMIWWKDYPDAFGFSYHTNAVNSHGNSFVFYTVQGERIPIPLGQAIMPANNRPFSSGFLKFILFIFTFGCILFFVCRRARL